ncbi:putative Aminomethyltransferase [Methylocella tundrae]|uniref:Putative Aminomethyltransferase n=2 Tax=Methylocella tundrae TaxID=227605 RepID=A0A4U8Z3F6_METTU|nr:putative Aminomethyltransferase [Methylocella tundrae]
MATDQGRTANLDALAIMAQLTGQSIPQTGVTLARPPVVPVALGAVAGAHRRGAFKPLRETPIHAYALERGAPFVDAGQWKRPQYFPLAGDADLLATANREVNAVRSGVGVTDVSTLGKVEVEGPDAAKFLDLVCAMRPSAIKVGRCGYLIMLREDGFLKDDGMFARFAEDRYVAYVSTAHAAPVYRHMQYCRQVLWPELDVNLTAVTDGWAQLAIAGPKSPAVLQALVDAPVLITQADFPPMRAAEITICGGVPARLCALSFSGERSFELGVPAGFGDALIRRVMAVGEPYGVVAYGSEAMGVMRIEKGHPAGGEINGQTTAYDLGMARALARTRIMSAASFARARRSSIRPGRASSASGRSIPVNAFAAARISSRPAPFLAPKRILAGSARPAGRQRCPPGSASPWRRAARTGSAKKCAFTIPFAAATSRPKSSPPASLIRKASAPVSDPLQHLMRPAPRPGSPSN